MEKKWDVIEWNKNEDGKVNKREKKLRVVYKMKMEMKIKVNRKKLKKRW